MIGHLDCLTRQDFFFRIGVDADLESRKVGLPFFSCALQVGKARCLRDKPYRTTYAMAIRYGRTGQILPFVKADSLFSLT